MAHTDRQPSQEVFDDIKENAKKVWGDYDNTYGYVDEKLERIEPIHNFADNWYTFLGMMDSNNQLKLTSSLKPETLEFLREQRVHYGYAMPREV